MLPNCEFFNHDELILYITLKDLPYIVNGLFDPAEMEKRMEYFDIAITKKPFSSIYCINKEREAVFDYFIERTLKEKNFRNIKNFDLPDNSKAMIYKK